MIDRLLTLPERRTGALIAVIGLLFTVAYTASLIVRPKPSGRIIAGDALHHYVQLRSAVFDRDLHFRNEYVRMYGLTGAEFGAEWVYEETKTGHVRNMMPVGPALLWMPLFLLLTAGVGVANAMGATYPLDGYGRLFQATAGLSGIAAATAGVWLSWKTCAKLFGARASAWSCLSLWLGSSAIYYSLISPTYSHAASVLAGSGFWYVWVQTRDGPSGHRYAALGSLAGAAALMRWQDAILLAPVGVDILARVRKSRSTPGESVGQLGLAIAAAVVTFVPQMIVWWVLYGRPLVLPQGPGFMLWTEPALFQVLLSDNHGLLTWTPIIILCLLGLPRLWRTDMTLAAGAITFLLLSWYVNAAVADWWAGEAFGSRRFLSCFPVFALGLTALVHGWAPTLRRLTLASGVIVALALLLLIQYQAFMHGMRDVVPYPRGFYGLWLARFKVPFDLLREWVMR